MRFVTLLFVGLASSSSPAADLLFTNEQLLEFQPRYRQADCFVKLEVAAADVEQVGRINEYSLYRAVVSARNRIAPDVLLPSITFNREVVGGLFVYFGRLHYATQCERRFEITEKIRHSLIGLNGIDVRILPDALAEEALVEPMNMGFWVDSPNYDPQLWSLLQRMWKGDPQALLTLGERSLAEGNFEGAFQSFGVAAMRLPEGSDRVRAIAGRDRAWEKIPPEHRERARESVKQNEKSLPRWPK